jgi:hypothetical protein
MTVAAEALTIRQVNRFMRDSLVADALDSVVPFFCECGRDACFRPVWLTAREYDVRRADEAWAAIAAAHGRALAA